MRGLALVAAWLVLILGLAEAGDAPAQGPCEPRSVAGAEYVICTLDLRRYELALFWRGPDGAPYGGFSALAKSPQGSKIVFAMNAGMFKEDRSPVGLYIENGQELKRANTANGPGNFHLKPNGVFYVAGQSAAVIETGRFLRQKPRVDHATQSGPMLVIDGQIHPKISENGPSRKIRNGVGMRDRNTVVFAISERVVTFGEFARLFRDELGCANALFLDGSVSSLFAPGLNRNDSLIPIGPMVGARPRA